MAELTDSAHDILRTTIHSRAAYRRDEERCKHLAEELGLGSSDDARGLLSSLEFIYDNVHVNDQEATDLKESIASFVESIGLKRGLGDEPDKTLARLSELVSYNEYVERQNKLIWLQTGLLDNATRISTFVDLRPDISDDRKSIKELVPILIISIELEAQSGEDKVCVFQTTRSGLGQIQTAIDDAFKKLECLSQHEQLSSMIGTDRNNGEDK